MTYIATSRLSLWKAYFEALRPKTLTASLVPVMVGTALAPYTLNQIHYFLAFSVFLSAVFIQIGTNLVNDALDFVKGADTEERLGPKRLIQQGLATPNSVLAAGFASFFLAFIAAIPLMVVGGWPFLGIVSLSILLGYFYTGGPFPLAYQGLGDLFVLVFFGPVLTLSAFYMQTGGVSFGASLAGLQVGLLSTVLIAINNTRDIEQDRKADKRTLAVRLGVHFNKALITFSVFAPFAISLLWLQENFFMCLFPFFTLPMAFNLVRGVWRSRPGNIYNIYLQEAAILHLCFGLLVSIGAHVS